jgi:hypothetical protein
MTTTGAPNTVGGSLSITVPAGGHLSVSPPTSPATATAASLTGTATTPANADVNNGVNGSYGNGIDAKLSSPITSNASAFASRKVGSEGKDSLTTFINEFTNEGSNWAILDAAARDQRINDWKAFRRGFIWRQFWDGLFKSKQFIEHTGVAITQRTGWSLIYLLFIIVVMYE